MSGDRRDCNKVLCKLSTFDMRGVVCGIYNLQPRPHVFVCLFLRVLSRFCMIVVSCLAVLAREGFEQMSHQFTLHITLRTLNV